MPDLHVVNTAEENARAAAEFVARTAAESVAARGRFAIALAGGATPRRLYQVLAERPYAGALPWGRWQVFFGDERCVPPASADSNFRMAKEALLDRVPIPAGQVHRIRGEDGAEAAAQAYESELAALFGPGVPAFDLVLLGIGADAHTASLFPGTQAVLERRRLVAAGWAPAMRAHRVTLTFPVINAARAVAFLASEGSKAGAVRRALQPAAHEDAPPAGLVRPASGVLHWFLTADAAGSLSGVGR